MLNALLWLAKVEVPAKGVEDKITEADLAMNLDEKPEEEVTRRAALAAAPSSATTAASCRRRVAGPHRQVECRR